MRSGNKKRPWQRTNETAIGRDVGMSGGHDRIVRRDVANGTAGIIERTAIPAERRNEFWRRTGSDRGSPRNLVGTAIRMVRSIAGNNAPAGYSLPQDCRQAWLHKPKL